MAVSLYGRANNSLGAHVRFAFAVVARSLPVLCFYNPRGASTSRLDKALRSVVGLVLRGNPVVDGWHRIPARKPGCAKAQYSWRITGWLKGWSPPVFIGRITFRARELSYREWIARNLARALLADC